MGKQSGGRAGVGIRFGKQSQVEGLLQINQNHNFEAALRPGPSGAKGCGWAATLAYPNF